MRNILLVTTLAQMGSLSAASFVVETGDTVTVSQVISGNSETGEVEEGGAIRTVPDFEEGVEMGLGSKQVMTNSGEIETLGDVSHGIHNLNGPDAKIKNEGVISTSGNSADGIVNEGSNGVKIENSGSILTTGELADGIVNINSDNVKIENRGTITTADLSSTGILSSGASNSTITNYGSIIATGDNTAPIAVLNSIDIEIVNHGLLEATGVNSPGIYSENVDNLKIVNSGTIASAQTFAINISSGLNPHLTLKDCSRIIGPVGSFEDLLNLDVKRGLNLYLTLDATSMDFGEVNSVNPYVLTDKTIAVVNPFDFAPEADILVDLSDTYLNGLANPCFDCCRGESFFWTHGLYSTRHREKGNERYRFGQAGFMAGLNFAVDCDTRVNLFGGYMAGRSKSREGECGSEYDSFNYVGGAGFEMEVCGGCLALNALAGWTTLDQTRNIFDNLADNGVAQNRSKRGGFFTTEEISYRYHICTRGFDPILFASVRYAGLFVGGDKEDGHVTALSFDRQSINMLSTRFLISKAFSSTTCGSTLTLEPFIGVNGRFALCGLTRRAEIFEERIYIPSAVDHCLAALLFGVKGCLTCGSFHLYTNLEGEVEGNKSDRFIAVAGLAFSF